MRDVLAQAGIETVGPLLVDGRRVGSSESFADVCRPGSVIDLTGDAASAVCGGLAAAPDMHAVRVVGGLHAGVTHDVGTRSEIVVGRSPQADVVVDDPTVSPLHVRLCRLGGRWFADDLGSHNGTAVAGERVRADEPVEGRVVCVGATSIVVGPLEAEIAHVRRPGADSMTPFNRPPRPTPTAVAGAIAVPDPPAERRRGAAFSVVALLGPILIGAVMVQVFGSMRYALFALLAPVMMITNAVATRRRNAKDAKSSARRFRRDVAAFEHALATAAVDEANRRNRALDDLATLRRRAEVGSVRLWERRSRHPDTLALRLGTGPGPWSPPVDPNRVAAHPELQRVVADHGVVIGSALELSLADGGVVGIVGDREVALAVARSLVVQATALHGPSDLALAVVAAAGSGQAWDWTKWLPHTRAGEGRLLAEGPDAAGALLGALEEARGPRPAPASQRVEVDVARPPLMLVVDGDELTTARRAPARAFLRGTHGPVAGVVVAASAERLPSSCSTVVHLDGALGAATVHDVASDHTVDDVVVDGISITDAESMARAMASFSDPDVRALGSDVPLRCGLLEALGVGRGAVGDVSSDQVGQIWARRSADDSLEVPLGLGPDGPVLVDLVADGPHALVGGTTGAGKSEFLRSVVAGLAARHRPDDLVFVLIDYKGGSAFDACARLPHTVGLVTDLDGHLAERALRSLGAELHHRERVLRAAGASDLGEYRRGDQREPLPRLVLVVDEFATLAAELPEFMSSLVGIAQRGRSLGVHMVLATQRPAGAVSVDIKANTNIRVALRMQDDRDSVDVIDTADAAGIDRRTPGRALVRLGPGELVTVQTPLSTAVSIDGGSTVRLAPFLFGETATIEPCASPDVATDLDALVEATCRAHHGSGGRPPRRPWLDMVGSVELGRLVGEASGPGIPLALADDPDHQRHAVASWDPVDGHLALLGAVGSGTSTALRTSALAAVGASSRPVHLYGVDYGGGLADLEPLDGCGAIIGGHDRERQRRLVDLLRSELSRRRSTPGDAAAWPLLLLLVDDLPAWLADHADAPGQEVVDDVRRLFADGPSVGLAVAFTADRAAAVPMRLWGAVTRRFLFRHADPDELTATGLRRHEVPEFVPGMAIDGSTRLVVQFPAPPTDLSVAGAGRPVSTRPFAIEALPDVVTIDALGDADVIADDACWHLPVGIDAEHHRAARLPVRPGDGVLVAGPANSGVSTALETLARQVRRHVPGAVLVAIADDRSPLTRIHGLFDAVGALGDLGKVLDVAAIDEERSWFVVVDDAHLHDEPGALEPLLRPGSPCRVVVGGRSEHLHGSFGHWTRAVRRSSTGLLLNPRLDTDGDLLGVRLPRHLSVPLHPGRGFLVADADAAVVQFAA